MVQADDPEWICVNDWIRIDDPSDPAISDFVGLRDRHLRTRSRSSDPDSAVFVAEGDPVVERALGAGLELVSLLVDATRTSGLPDGLTSDSTVFAAGPDVLRAITGMAVHRGSMGVFLRPPDRSPAEVVEASSRLVVLEGVTNPINMGVIVRTASGLGVDGMIIDALCVDPLYRRASRVAMGEVYDFAFARTGRFPAGLAPVVDAGFELVALTPDSASEPLGGRRWSADAKVALVLGAEGAGLTDATLAACHRRVQIPVGGRVDSLNVAAAAAIACWELTRSPCAPAPAPAPTP